jgi:hypothetical protein
MVRFFDDGKLVAETIPELFGAAEIGRNRPAGLPKHKLGALSFSR